MWLGKSEYNEMWWVKYYFSFDVGQGWGSTTAARIDLKNSSAHGLRAFEFMRISLVFTRRLLAPSYSGVGERQMFHVPSKPINLSDCLPSSSRIPCFSLFSNIINKKLDGFSLAPSHPL